MRGHEESVYPASELRNQYVSSSEVMGKGGKGKVMSDILGAESKIRCCSGCSIPFFHHGSPLYS